MNSFEEFDCNYIFVVGNYNRIVQLWGGESVQDEINKTVHLVAIKFFKAQKYLRGFYKMQDMEFLRRCYTYHIFLK